MDEPLVIGDRAFGSRLILGTGKYDTPQQTVEAIRASGAEMVTVAVRRVDLNADNRDSLLHYLDPEEFFLLLSSTGNAFRRCERIWVNGSEVGVKFLKEMPSEVRPQLAADRRKQGWHRAGRHA